MKTITIFLTLALALFTVQESSARHIIGGHLTYKVIGPMSGNAFRVGCEFKMFRDPTGGGANFDTPAMFGIYRVINDKLHFVSMAYSNPTSVISVGSDILSCNNDLSHYDVGTYEFEVSLPNNGDDYVIAYQRCCLSSDIIGIENVEETGMLFYTKISSNSLIATSAAPIFTQLDRRFFEVGKTHDLGFSLMDEDGDEIRIITTTAYRGGGIAGVSFGDPQGCDGITPNPANCIPEFYPVTYESGFSAEEPFGETGTLTNDNGSISFRSDKIGIFLLAFEIEEWRGNQLLSSSIYQTSVIIGLRDIYAVEGRFYYDENKNEIYDEGEPPFVIPPGIKDDYCVYAVTEDFDFRAYSQEDKVVFVNTAEHWTFSNGTNEYDSGVLMLNQITNRDIGFIPKNQASSIQLDVINPFSICNETLDFKIKVLNNGNLPINDGVLQISNLTNIEIQSCQCTFTKEDDLFSIELGDLGVLQDLQFVLTGKFADETHTGKPVNFDIDLIVNGESIYKTKYEDVLLCSFDPNDITVLPKRLPDHVIENDERLQVLVRFENMGNFYASNIRIEQVLDENLDLNTIKIIEASHDFELLKSREGSEQKLEINFEDISLPGTNDSIAENRQGYIMYSIDLVPNLELGTIINHDALIFFDLNEPIATNLFTNLIGELVQVEPPVEEGEFKMYPNPTNDILYFENIENFTNYTLYNRLNQNVKFGELQDQLSLKTLDSGLYIIVLQTADGHRVGKRFVKM